MITVVIINPTPNLQCYQLFCLSALWADGISPLCLQGSKEVRIFWKVWEDSQGCNQQQHILCWFTGDLTAQKI